MSVQIAFANFLIAHFALHILKNNFLIILHHFLWPILHHRQQPKVRRKSPVQYDKIPQKFPVVLQFSELSLNSLVLDLQQKGIIDWPL